MPIIMGEMSTELEILTSDGGVMMATLSVKDLTNRNKMLMADLKGVELIR